MSHIDIPSRHRALVVDSSQSGWEVKEQALPAYDDLLVKVRAAALNPTDWKHVHAKRLKSGNSTGSDFTGVVVAAKGRTPYKAGDRVAGFTRGGFCTRITVLSPLSGLKVYTTASKHHHDALAALGADAVFDYRDPEVVQKIRTASGGGIRVALDGISEYGSTALAAQALSDAGGKIVSLLGRPEGEYPANVEIVPTLLYSVLEEKNEVDRADIAAWHTYIPKLLEDGKLRVHSIDHQSGGLEAIPEGLAKLREGKVSGQKIVYTISK